jgi:hypothetical protein
MVCICIKKSAVGNTNILSQVHLEHFLEQSERNSVNIKTFANPHQTHLSGTHIMISWTSPVRQLLNF